MRLTTEPVAKTRIFQVASGWFPESKGGAENVAYNLMLELQRLDFEFCGIVPGSERVERDTAGRFRSLAPRASVFARSLMARRLSMQHLKEEVDLVASHFALYTFPLLDKIGKRPFIVHFHGPWAMESLAEGTASLAVWVKRAIERAVYRRADRIIVLSNAFGALLRDEYGVRDEVIRLVPGGVDCEHFAPRQTRNEALKTLDWQPGRPTLLAVRRLVRRMGLDRLIEAVALLRRPYPEMRLYIAGTGPERIALEALVTERGLSEQIRFVGFLADELVPLAYQAADFTIVPTVELEGFGLIAAESLAVGTPVLVTPVGGLPEVVAGLSPAMVLAGPDAPAIAAGIAAVLTNTSSMPSTEACRTYAQSHFGWDVVGRRVADVYREVLE